MARAADEGVAGRRHAKGFEVGYELFTINGRMLGHGEPIRVKPGERVLFHVLNGSATEIRSLALPGHTFKVVALDGNPVPDTRPRCRCSGSARPSAFRRIVEMNHPGVWVMGDLADDDRAPRHGHRRRVCRRRRASRNGQAPQPFRWDYRGSASRRRAGRSAGRDDRDDRSPSTTPPLDGFNRGPSTATAFSMADDAADVHAAAAARATGCACATPATTSTRSTCTGTASS